MLNPFKYIICLTLNKRLAAGEVTILDELAARDIMAEVLLVGRAEDMPPNYQAVSHRVDTPPPYTDAGDTDAGDTDARRKWQNYNYCEGLKSLLAYFLEHSAEGELFWFLEDDARLNLPKFDMYWDAAWREVFYAEILGGADLIYIGGNHSLGEVSDIWVTDTTGRESKLFFLTKPTYSLDLHSVCFTRSGAAKVLGQASSPNRTIDGTIAELGMSGELNNYAFNPTLVTQKAGYSYNEFRQVNRAENHWL